jgi:hypothetical protein
VRISIIRTRAAAKLLPLVFLLTLPVALQAEDYIFTTNNGIITITGYTGTGGDVTVPDTITDLPVTRIGSRAFYSCTNLLSVTMLGGVTNIESEAFRSCTSLANVILPESVISIGSEAFRYCSGLTNFYFPKGVKSIGDNLFSFCTNLMTISVDASNNSFCSVDGVLFNKKQTYLVQCPAGRAGSYTIPNTVLLVLSRSFWSCLSLTNITIPNGVTGIHQAVFRHCSGLTSLTIPSSVGIIGGLTFDSCSKLAGVYFQGHSPILGGSDLFGESIATVYYLPGTTNWGTTYSGRPAVLWNPEVQTGDPSFGVRTNQFGFRIIGTPNIPIVVEACTDFSGPVWVALQSCKLTNGSLYFSDPQWTNHPTRFFHLRWP